MSLREAIDASGASVNARIQEVYIEIQSALAECRQRAALQRLYERDADKHGEKHQPWIAFVGGRIFNDYSKEGGDRPGTGPNERDPGSGGVLEPGDPGYGGDVLQPGDPGYGGGD